MKIPTNKSGKFNVFKVASYGCYDQRVEVQTLIRTEEFADVTDPKYWMDLLDPDHTWLSERDLNIVDTLGKFYVFVWCRLGDEFDLHYILENLD